MQTRRQFMRASALTGLALLLNSDLYGQNQSNVSERDFRYAIVTSKDTYRGEWAKPSDTLKAKYQNRDHIFQFEDDISEIRDALREYAPTHVALVAKPKELAIPYIPQISSFESLEEQRKIAESSLVGKFNVLLSQLDEDEYRDSIGGIITGYSAKDALKLAESTSFEVKTALLKTLFEKKNYFPNCIAFSDGLVNNEAVIRYEKQGNLAKETKIKIAGPELLEKINSNSIDLIVTSGHASNRDWHPGFNYPDDVFILNDKGEIEVKTQDGLIRGKVNSQNPKVYYAPGNCRIAQIKSPNEAIVLSWLQSGGVTQYFGYLIDTWHGVSGWGMAQHLLASDRPTFFEAHHMNCLAIQFLQEQIADYRVRNNLGKGEEEYGKVYDKNIFVGYGDPALEVRIGKSTEPFYEKEMKIEEVRETKYNLKVKIIRDNTSLSTPIVFLLPKKAVSPRVTGAPNFSYKIGDNFAILDVGHDIFNENNAPRLRPRELKKGSEWTLEFYTKPGN